MKDSNWSLRWNRSAREAYGHDIEFNEDTKNPDTFVLLVSIFAIGFILGVLV